MGLWQLGRVVLEWHEEGPLLGLRVVMRRRPVGELTDLWEQSGVDNERPLSEMTSAERAAATRKNAADLAALIVEWNIDNGKGEMAPITAKSLMARCDFTTINAIWDRYRDETTRVAPPLPSSSDAGEPSEEQALQLPTEPLPTSPT